MPRRPDPSPHESWGAAMQDYVYHKSHDAPPIDGSMVRYSRTDGTVRKRLDRNFNIVTGTDRPAGGTSTTTAPLEATESRLAASRVDEAERVTRAIQRDMKKSYHVYDIVTMAPKYGVQEADVQAVGGNQEPRGKRTSAPTPGVNYDIITTKRVAGREHIPDEPPPPALRGKSKPERQTNILNHRFLKLHEERVAQEQQEVQAKIDHAVSSTSQFNPISQQYTDATMERAARQEKADAEEKKRETVRTHTYDTSKIVKRSEGHAFDIVTNHVYNPEMVLRLDQREATRLPQRAALRQQWEYQRDAEEALRTADIERALNRVAHPERKKAEVGHGYDVLSNQPYVKADEENTKTKPHLVTLAKSKPPTAMDCLSEKLASKPAKPVEVFREDGPRSTTERLFHTTDPRLSHGSSFEGRQKLLLPTLEKVKARAPDTGSAFTATR